MYESAEEKKKREGKGENIWKRKGSFLRRRRQTEKEEKENNRKKKKFRRRKRKRRKILGEGKYIFFCGGEGQKEKLLYMGGWVIAYWLWSKMLVDG